MEAISKIQKSNINPTGKWFLRNESLLNFSLNIQRNLVWDLDKQSLFIHSLIVGYPVPPYFTQDNGDDILWVLDGKQRITTINSYMKDEFALGKKTPIAYGINIVGLKFSELPQEFQEEIRDYSFSVIRFKNITSEQRDEIFLRLNNGMALTKMELTRVMASSNVMEFINEISKYEFFQNIIAISDSQRNRFTDQEIILQILSVLINGYTKGFSSKELQEFALKLKEDGIQDNIKEVMKNTTDYIYQAIPVKEKFMKKVNIPIIFNIAVKAQNNEITPEKFGGFLQDFFSNTPDEYDYATDSGSAKKENVKVRIDELNKYFDNNINSAPNYQKPKEKVKGQVGRPLGSGKKNKEEKLTDSNPPADPTPMAAAGNPS
jgi:hypothetical protein